ncbi:RES family NAD+ phosphorylase [Litoreibacter arenae]|uniref:RES family NAD+ phosphorylase n=1 Tax=Litoreibacter arenae TaxID=491388 RepID=UPI0005934BDC|nr:RES family NAD+ phosphorylase [Litoreibacter arenae]
MFTSNIHVEEIKRRIEQFRRDAEKGIQDADIIMRLSSIFGSDFSFLAQNRHYEKGTQFFRARAIDNSDTNIPLRTISCEADAWEPPAEFIRTQGRLNLVGQGILYCCPGDPDLAIDEARARGNNHVAVMVYRSVRKINVAVLGDYQKSALPKDDMTQMFYSFLEEEFARDVPPGHEDRYSITRAIADTFFNLPYQDAWCYRSVQSPQKYNVAFLPGRSRQNLELVGVMICDLRHHLPSQLKVKMVVDFDKNTGEARYHRIGSSAQKGLFPEIS